jgi:hypothetical protein
MKTTTLLLTALALALVFGCSPSETTETPASTPTTSTEPAASEPEVAMSKCDGCGKEVPFSTIVSHDGQQLCPDCVAEHDH